MTDRIFRCTLELLEDGVVLQARTETSESPDSAMASVSADVGGLAGEAVLRHVEALLRAGDLCESQLRTIDAGFSYLQAVGDGRQSVPGGELGELMDLWENVRKRLDR